jgi:hypothetical protein
MLSKFFKFVKKNNEDIILFIGVALISFLSFTVGYIISEASRDEPMQIETNADIENTQIVDKIQMNE